MKYYIIATLKNRKDVHIITSNGMFCGVYTLRDNETFSVNGNILSIVSGNMVYFYECGPSVIRFKYSTNI